MKHQELPIPICRNSVTILALCRCPKLRSHATTAFVLSLCISDLLFCSVNLPLTTVRYINEEWTLGDALCKLFPVLFYGNVAVSLLNMVAITLSRYILIAYSKYYEQLYSKTAIWVQIIAVWGIAILIMLPPSLEIWGRLGLNPSTFSCTILEKDGSSPKKVLFLIGFVLPCVVIIISYSCIYWKVRMSRLNLLKHQSVNKKDRMTQKREKDDNRLTKLMLIIFVCFLCCFLPLMMMNVFDDDVAYPSLHVLASILAWASSVVNPFIYAASNRQYRSAYSKLFRIFQSVVTVSKPGSGSTDFRAIEKNGQQCTSKANLDLS
ncbi:protein trapped in endoderm-1-like isoform X1 [Coccinella septempunctata]|uniref:protein trapped in endoderm-1-like isoform X1 n=1 Tax=Coccinella septempunctata TaxID=41139 RepID=UPI001D07362A|nr:protein trapped in endoderm-1-like isoform X1 [Coccinella septempunctata]